MPRVWVALFAVVSVWSDVRGPFVDGAATEPVATQSESWWIVATGGGHRDGEWQSTDPAPDLASWRTRYEGRVFASSPWFMW